MSPRDGFRSAFLETLEALKLWGQTSHTAALWVL